MKKVREIIAVLCLSAVLSFIPSAVFGQEAIDVMVRVYQAAAVDTSEPPFIIWRDGVICELATFGYPSTNAARAASPSNREISPVFQVSDMCVPSTNFFDRGVFNPLPPNQTRRGNRPYSLLILTGINGKVSQSRVSYEVICGITNYNNSASLAGLPYSVSRAGKDVGGVLKTTGPGTDLVDTFIFIGARFGATVNVPEELAILNNAIAGLPGGYMPVTVVYKYVLFTGSTISRSFSLRVYPDGMIPRAYNKLWIFPTPRSDSFFVSLVGPANSSPMTLLSNSVLGTWNAMGTASEGSSFVMRTDVGSGFFSFRVDASGARSVDSGIIPLKTVIFPITVRGVLPAANGGLEIDQDSQ
ncbi:MAG: hypothetical protein A3G04_02425 [Candidatus Taylorbacteria bacterium RIFCSPLOWO2_12_FULL_44_9]|nr:MAG: hypothetical protein A3G04_02425 [Candidatus Taylorbacteria bacterium RIFCSPLOWO2_12_FULL_44_9]